MGFKSAGTKSGFGALCRRLTTQYVSINYHLQSLIAGLFDGQVRVFLILSPKCTKITTFLQITPKPENILKRLQNNYNVFKNTYIPWLKVDKIHDIPAIFEVFSSQVHTRPGEHDLLSYFRCAVFFPTEWYQSFLF